MRDLAARLPSRRLRHLALIAVLAFGAPLIATAAWTSGQAGHGLMLRLSRRSPVVG
ncbi:hypothetical protein HCN51_11625 [Nonomuraea sp. FMUSA5-5]|uniref:Uncharacterized protein n=1 Tax=Nonomuraea composti TaxID=2720023 RepID=A0ABX1AWT7_9ACTN|nr:hypothetical protein [Nonomuraea sp. FMUSA5-5]NJP90090.1 hypothetical protein [Nonomuraea sp. FMUSA5-5]